MSGIKGEELAEQSIASRWDGTVEAIRTEYLAKNQNFPWIVGFSGGKDSTVVLHAVFEALLSIPPSLRTRVVHVVSNDTLVESPFVMGHLNTVALEVEKAASNLGLPIIVVRTTPEIDKSFWVLLIGKG